MSAPRTTQSSTKSLMSAANLAFAILVGQSPHQNNLIFKSKLSSNILITVMIAPEKIFKYFNNKEFQNSFLNNGFVYFNSLLYFTSCEDKSRQDTSETMNIYRPKEGLKINILNSGNSYNDKRQLISSVKNPHRIFVFCTSLEYSENLKRKFNSYGCIEVSDLCEFQNRIKRALNNKFRLKLIKNKTLLCGSVDYYNPENGPNSRHACPDQIIMSKTKDFIDEREYRFAFAKDQNSFDVNNVDYLISPRVPALKKPHTNQILRLGNLSDICKEIK